MSTTQRPHRHLCPDADARDAMNDSEFWAHVYPSTTTDELYDQPEVDVQIADVPCNECGEIGACAYDVEGRPLIHTTVEETDA